MQRILLLIWMMVITISLTAVHIEFKDGLKLNCEIVGKQADTLYVSYNELLYKVKKEDIASINTWSGSGNQKNLFFEKIDWMNESVNHKSAKYYQVINSDYTELVKAPTLKSIDDMNDREFQMYLAQTQAQALKESTRKITRTMWVIVVVNIVLGITIAGMK